MLSARSGVSLLLVLPPNLHFGHSERLFHLNVHFQAYTQGLSRPIQWLVAERARGWGRQTVAIDKDRIHDVTSIRPSRPSTRHGDVTTPHPHGSRSAPLLPSTVGRPGERDWMVNTLLPQMVASTAGRAASDCTCRKVNARMQGGGSRN